MKRGIKKDWDSIWKTANNMYDEMGIMEDWVNDWIERDKDSKFMSDEQQAYHEIDKKKINQHLCELVGWTETLKNTIMENLSIIDYENKILLEKLRYYNVGFMKKN